MHTVIAKSILSPKNGMNVYRGCTHGCIYCDSRSVCYGMKHDFEDIEVKINAPELLEHALYSKKKKCMIGTGSMSDPYNHYEEKLQLTRKCLEIINRHGFGATLITKSDMLLRDLDLLHNINNTARAVVQMTLTTFDDALCSIIEPAAPTTARRAEVLRILHNEGIPTVVWLCPILPFINDTEENLRGILSLCFDAGVKGIISFGMGVTLRDGDREYFFKALDKHFPGIKQKYLQYFGLDYECPSPDSSRLTGIFNEECAKRGIMTDTGEIFTYLNHWNDSKAEQISFI